MDSKGIRGTQRTSVKRRVADFVERRARPYIKHFVRPYVVTETSAFRNFDRARELRATFDSLDYAEAHMQGAEVCTEKPQVLEHALRHVRNDGLFLEFGVWSGKTINFIAERHDGLVHGFDSFEGLPEDWIMHYRKGRFSTGGRPPQVRNNVRLHIGWFDEALPRFVQEHREAVAFLHVDCDLYSSTKTVFRFLGDRIVPGSVIVFDEYFNYPGWREHEFKAFQEFVSERALRYRYIAYNQCQWNVAAVIL